MAKGSGGGGRSGRFSADSLRAYGAARGVQVTVNKNYYGKGRNRYVVQKGKRRQTMSSPLDVRASVRELGG